MRFGDDPELAPYLNRKDQRRLLAMVAVLCLVVVGVNWAARPESWYWLVPPGNETAQNDPVQNNADANKQSSAHDVDLGAITAGNPQEKTSAGRGANHTGGVTEAEKKTESESPSLATADLPAQWLEPISDQVMGLRVKEADTYYRTLAHVSRLDDRFLKKHARSDVLYVNLLRNPDSYRGKLITIRGTARRITKTEVGKNKYGIQKAYEAWLLTPDSGSDLIRLVATDLDSRLPTGKEVSVEVEATGYFLKLYSYASQGGQHQAPLILAARIQPSVVRTSVPDGTGLEPYILFFALFVGCTTIIAATLYSRGDRKFKQKLKADFPDLDTPPENFLEQLKDQETEKKLFS